MLAVLQVGTNSSASFIGHIGSYHVLGSVGTRTHIENSYGNLGKWLMQKEMTCEEKFAFLAYVHFLS